jgi:hypothetical protein
MSIEPGPAIVLDLRSQILKELVMAKGQMRSSKEKKKPKAEWNKKKKGGPAPPSSTVGQIQSAAGQNPFTKKA